MTSLAGFSHVSLSVRDRDRSAEWYGKVFGFSVFETIEEQAYVEAIMIHPAGMILCLQQHLANAGEAFDPVRTGGDHIAFRVNSREELLVWENVLNQHGARYTPVVDRHYGSVVCVRDPDDIQLELFYRENHP